MPLIKDGTENGTDSELHDHLAFDQDFVLGGFSMGTGELTRSLGTYGSAGISRAVLIGSIPPYLLEKVPVDVFDGIKQGIVADRYAFFESFLDRKSVV